MRSISVLLFITLSLSLVNAAVNTTVFSVVNFEKPGCTGASPGLAVVGVFNVCFNDMNMYKRTNNNVTLSTYSASACTGTELSSVPVFTLNDCVTRGSASTKYILGDKYSLSSHLSPSTSTLFASLCLLSLLFIGL